MIRSMTGYGEASAQYEGVHFFVELRSLNNKYFKAVIRLPDEFQGLEAEMEARLRGRLTRGTITMTGSCTDSSESAAHQVNQRALARYIAQLREVAAAAGLDRPIDPAALLGLPGVLQPPENEEARVNRARRAFLELLDRAIAGLVAMREREGTLLVNDLLAQRGVIAERLRQISARAPSVVNDMERRLRQRIEQMTAELGLKIEPVDIVREIAVYAERTDVAEEITRLSGHLEQFGELLATDGGKPVGRTLDFVAQEMLREANTMASKSPDASISRWTVEIKGAIDRIKEQCQNVE